MMYNEMDGYKYISETDHLNVVEEKENQKIFLTGEIGILNLVIESKNKTNDTLRKELKEKDEEIERLKSANRSLYSQCIDCEKEIKDLKETHVEYVETGYRNDILQEELEKAKDINIELAFKNMELKNKIHFCKIDQLTKYMSDNYPCFAGMQVVDVVISLLEGLKEEKEEKEELWTLRYKLIINDREKEVVQYHMIKEDAEELIGMDSFNWISYSMEKEVR